ncbi:MAG: S-methyl-5-thioribose-1-phosphate isomerase [Phycisphaerae bacterium]|nr:S-methyl-5-thioribose-1-phosphate isomerase [Phycisphaerae bacterium]
MTNNEIHIHPPVAVAEWIGQAADGFLRLLDQTLLPTETTYLDCRSREDVFDAIRRLVVRGAPAIGVAAGYGMVVGSQVIPNDADFPAELETLAAYLEKSRPTAVNLSWAVRRVLQRAKSTSGDAAAIRQAMLEEARAIHAEDEKMCLAIGRYAEKLITPGMGVLTHCNAGALATVGVGTATAGMYLAHAMGRAFTVYCDETRPLLQGSRLTAWELQQAGVNAVVITDNMAGWVMKEKRVQLVIVGADRIAANGDTANKIGTYSLAVLAARHGIPFYVAAPYSTFDLTLKSGEEIPIEQRGSEEITAGLGRRTAPEGIATYSPAFDVTPAELIYGIVTDRGIAQPVKEQTIRGLMA